MMGCSVAESVGKLFIDGKEGLKEIEPVEISGEKMITVDAAKQVFPIDEDVTPYSNGIALHTEYYDEDDTFFNLNTSFIGSPQTSRGFSWQAMPEYDNMVIQYSEGTALGDNPTEITASYTNENVVYNLKVTEPMQDISYYDDMLFYKVGITDLEPGKTYSYRIGDKDKDEWSAVYSFTTEADDVDKFSIIAVADTQSTNVQGFAYYTQVLEAAHKDVTNPAFIAHLGDITDNGMCDDWWNMFFEASKSVCEKLPMVAVVGNHETRALAAKYYNLHFMNPTNGAGIVTGDYSNADRYTKAVLDELDNTVYSFDYGNAHFAVLNTGSDWGKSKIMLDGQREWLKQDMASTSKKWKVLLLHIGVYPAKERRDHVTDLYSLIGECDIDLVMQGHDHITMRTKPMTGAEYGAYGEDTDGNVDTIVHSEGTVYQVMGCAGEKRYRYGVDSVIPNAGWLAKTPIETASNNPSYNIITFDEDSINVLSKAINGDILDSYEITK